MIGLEPENITEVSEDDYLGPVPCVPKQTTNYYLLLAFIFTFLCGLWHVSTSHCTRWLLDTVRNLWREAEIQHEHEDWDFFYESQFFVRWPDEDSYRLLKFMTVCEMDGKTHLRSHDKCHCLHCVWLWYKLYSKETIQHWK